MDTYHTRLLDHYHRPRNNEPLKNPTFRSSEHNPSCGDSITIEGYIKNNIVESISFQARGCIINQGFASMLTEHCIGKTLESIHSLTNEDIITMIGIPLGPIRLKCALLCLHTLQEGINSYQNKL